MCKFNKNRITDVEDRTNTMTYVGTKAQGASLLFCCCAASALVVQTVYVVPNLGHPTDLPHMHHVDPCRPVDAEKTNCPYEAEDRDLSGLVCLAESWTSTQDQRVCYIHGYGNKNRARERREDTKQNFQKNEEVLAITEEFLGVTKEVLRFVEEVRHSLVLLGVTEEVVEVLYEVLRSCRRF